MHGKHMHTSALSYAKKKTQKPKTIWRQNFLKIKDEITSREINTLLSKLKNS